MTSFRQIEANRRNAFRSTGPKTDEGKRRSRRNALRHGLTAETVINDLEDSEDYRAFEAAVIADYDAQTAVERELVLRLASLLWRLRRIIAIETGLLKIQSDIVRERGASFRESPVEPDESGFSLHSPPLGFDQPGAVGLEGEEETSPCGAAAVSLRDLPFCFLRLSNVDNGAFERLGRYNALLWRQTAQTLLLLQTVRRHPVERFV
jgi:hypothetical protein